MQLTISIQVRNSEKCLQTIIIIQVYAQVSFCWRPVFCNGLFTETILICLKCLQIIIKSCQALWNAGTYVRAQVLFLYFCVVLLTNVRDGFQETTPQCF